MGRVGYGLGLTRVSIEGNLSQVKNFLSKGASIHTNLAATGETPLTLATKHGHTSLVKYLVEQGANVQVRLYSIRETPDTKLRWMTTQLSNMMRGYIYDYWCDGENIDPEIRKMLVSARSLLDAAKKGELETVHKMVEDHIRQLSVR